MSAIGLTATDLLDALWQTLGPTAVLVGDDLPERNRTDWSFLPPTAPLAVIRPESAEEVAAALRLCHTRRAFRSRRRAG